VSWGTSTVDTVTFDATGRSVTSMGWSYREYPVAASAAVTRLRFESLTAGSFGPVLDDVSVTTAGGPAPSPTPPPPTQTTQPVGPEGSEVPVAGGAGQDGGVTLRIPAGTLSATTDLTVSVTNAAPSGVTASGSVLLPKTIEITPASPVALAQAVRLLINLTTADLDGRDVSTVKGGVIVGAIFDPRPTFVVDAAQGTVEVMLDHFSKFSVITIQSVGPGSPEPPAGAVLDSFTVTMNWNNPPGTTQYQLQVVPFNGDGPGVDIVRNVESSLTVPPPPQGYGLLPDMTYFWRVRSTTVTRSPAVTDWPAWGSWTFKTPKVTGASISPVAPPVGSAVSSVTPTLTWANSNPAVFYYELQASKDARFNVGPATATATVYSALLHGGVTTPPNSYRIPAQFPLESGTIYHWRVRPRVQGDGVPLAWSEAWTFRTP